jgi:hypothetical protein
MTERSSNPYAESSPEMDRKIRECTDPNELQQLLSQLMAARGVQTRGVTGTYDRTADAEVPTQTSASSRETPVEQAGHLVRVFYVQNDRYEIFASSSESLTEKENRIRATYR